MRLHAYRNSLHALIPSARCSGTKWISLATLCVSSNAACRAISADCIRLRAMASAMNCPPVMGGYFLPGPWMMMLERAWLKNAIEYLGPRGSSPVGRRTR